ncbi:MAG TPA: sigma-54 dependent transcriptional regulator, partial [Thermoanaerobaculia bacterium]
MSALPIRILVSDDQQHVVDTLRLLLKTRGFEVETVSSPVAATRIVESREFDVVLLDLNYRRDTTSGEEGLEIISAIQTVDPTLPIVVMTAFGSIDVAVEAMRRGARDFVQKPWDNERLVATIRTQADLGRAIRKGQVLEMENRELRANVQHPDLIADSEAMRPLLDVINRVGPSDANVLILGENGSGKGVIARALHAVSRRANKTLVSVNIGGISESLFESELFGHVRGAFTDAKADRVGRFELADGGTLLLDEIANMPLTQQAKLLRVIETGEFERVGSSQTKRANVRILSATNARLQDEVAQGRFREDLLFRLNTVTIVVPPLRERRDDIPKLAAHFLRIYGLRYRKPMRGFDEKATRALYEYGWPGNVRELDHVVERAVLMATTSQVTTADLALGGVAESYPRLEDLSLEE